MMKPIDDLTPDEYCALLRTLAVESARLDFRKRNPGCTDAAALEYAAAHWSEEVFLDRAETALDFIEESQRRRAAAAALN